MKYILAAIFLIGTTLSYPLGESDESKQPEASIINPNSLSSPKSQESDEVPKHHEHHHDEAHKDVSHEHHKEPQRDSLEASEESLESNEKPEQQPKIIESAPEEIKPLEEKLLDKPDEEEKKPEGKEVEEPKIADEKSHVEEPIDIVEAVNKPAAIAAESAVPDEQFIKNIEHIPEKKAEEPVPQFDSVPDQPHVVDESPIEQGNFVAAEENAPQSEGKSDLIDIPQAIKEDELKIQKPAEEISAPLPIEADIEKEAFISKENEAKKLLPELISDKPEEVSHSS